MDRARLLQAAESLVGVPFIAGGRTHAGADCRGIVELFFSDLGFAVPSSADLEPENMDGHAFADAFEPVDDLRDGDVVRFIGGQSKRHIGVWVQGHILHAVDGPGAVIQPARRFNLAAPHYRLKEMAP